MNDKNELIPITPELECLKEFLAYHKLNQRRDNYEREHWETLNRFGRTARREEKLMNAPWTGRFG